VPGRISAVNGPSWRAEYTSVTHDKVRYGDTDRQGHVNNAVFSSFFETGRVEFLYDPERPMARDGAEFVIVSSKIDMEGEITWPGRVEFGTRVARIGTSSVTIQQGLFQNDRRVATAETVIVQIDQATRRSAPLEAETVRRLEKLKGS
jgi:acyl-CoA thioester hydrolase